MNVNKRHLVSMLCVLLGACVTGYALVTPGSTMVGDLQVRTGPGWNQVPAAAIPWARNGTVAWTMNGMSLDRLVIITGVPDGESIYFGRQATDYPVFRAHMSEPELCALLAETIQQAQGTNRTTVKTGGIRPHRFGRAEGMVFDIDADVLDGPAYRGVAGAFVAGGKLYLLYFLAAVPYYFDQQIAAAESVIESASL